MSGPPQPEKPASIWIVTYDGCETPVPFAHPVSRQEASELLIGAEALRPVQKLTDRDSTELAALLLRVLNHGTAEQRVKVSALSLDDPPAALAQLRALVVDIQ